MKPIYSLLIPLICFSGIGYWTNINHPIIKTENYFSKQLIAMTCQRNDIDPCNYSDGEDFALAVIGELNNVVNGCPYSFCEQNCCNDDRTWGPTFPINTTPQKNPWFYCYNRTSCTPSDCEVPGGGSIHYEMDIELQDSVMTRARVWALANRPICGGVLSQIKKIEFIIESVPGASCTETSGCYDHQMKVKVYYYQCNCSDN